MKERKAGGSMGGGNPSDLGTINNQIFKVWPALALSAVVGKPNTHGAPHKRYSRAHRVRPSTVNRWPNSLAWQRLDCVSEPSIFQGFWRFQEP